MKLPLSWLKDWVAVPWSAEELARRLTFSGFEVEGSEVAAPPFSGVVVAEILEAQPHPQADKLQVCKVSAGSGAPLQIVCGAPNARPGLKTALAQVGAVLPGDLNIKAAKLRGVESAGMLCSARELGLSTAHEGIIELAADAPPGASLRQYLDLDDPVIELKVYPNRGDALSVQGLAREVAALTGGAITGPEVAAVPAAIDATHPSFVDAPRGAPRLLTRVLKGVNNRVRSPAWLRERLRRSGLRAISPAVDVTNFVMLELGQPMHAYDRTRLAGELRVRMARQGEPLKLLDGRDVVLDGDTLVIADRERIIGLAGIMGGEGTSITEEASDILLEAAFFAPDAINGRARRHGLQTDSSQRFERGVDPHGQHRAMERATALLLAIAGGAAGPIVEQFEPAALPARAPVTLRRSRLRQLVGVELPPAQVEGALHALQMQVEATGDGWRVTPPSWRFDITLEADLAEEAMRIIGYDQIPEAPKALPQQFRRRPESVVDERALLDTLVGRGYQEVLSYTFVDPALQQRLFPQASGIRLANPIAADLSVMRVSLWPGLIKTALENLNRQQDRVRLFECGAVFLREGAGVREVRRVAGLATGARLPEQWGSARASVDFFDAKSDVGAVLALAGPGATLNWEAAEIACLHPGRSAAILRGGARVGSLGELHPSLAAELGFAGTCLLFELDIIPALEAPLPQLTPVSRYPQVRRDLSITIPEATPLSAILDRVSVAAGSLLRDIRVFDLYQGPGIEPTRKSIALGLIFQDNNRTLKDDEADGLMAAVAADLDRSFGAKIRD
ncbi:MAG: phenylalanine--tRNA ligase subunit beta [Steroidobacteraceae bacterium]